MRTDEDDWDDTLRDALTDAEQEVADLRARLAQQAAMHARIRRMGP